MQDHDSRQPIRCSAADVFILRSFDCGKVSRRLVANVTSCALVYTTNTTIDAAEAECAKGVGVGLVLVSHVTEIDLKEAEMVDDGCGDSDEEKKEGGDEEEEDSEAVLKSVWRSGCQREACYSQVKSRARLHLAGS